MFLYIILMESGCVFFCAVYLFVNASEIHLLVLINRCFLLPLSEYSSEHSTVRFFPASGHSFGVLFLAIINKKGSSVTEYVCYKCVVIPLEYLFLK